MERFGLGERWSLLYDGGREVVGRSRAEVVERRAPLGAAAQRDGLPRRRGDPRRRPRCAPSSTSTPASARCGSELGLARAVRGPRPLRDGRRADRPRRLRDPDLRDRLDHDAAAGRALRVAGPAPNPAARFTSVASWRGPFGPIEYEGRTYGLRVHEFRRFVELPGRTVDRVRGRARHRRGRGRGPAAHLRRTAGSWPTRARSRATPGATATTCSARRPS